MFKVYQVCSYNNIYYSNNLPDFEVDGYAIVSITHHQINIRQGVIEHTFIVKYKEKKYE